MSSEPDLELGCHYDSGVTSFPHVVRLMRSDEDNDLVVFRSFKKLNLYVLLHKQGRLIKLEKEVSEIEDKNRPEKLLVPILKAEKWLDDYSMPVPDLHVYVRAMRPDQTPRSSSCSLCRRPETIEATSPHHQSPS